MFKRRLGYYLFHTYVPTCLIVIMSWISFWIKPEAVPARVTLGVTSLLTLSTQHANSQKALPPVSYIKAIDMFMNACTVFVFCSLIEYALINVIMGDASDIERRRKEKEKGNRLCNIVKKAKKEIRKQTINCVAQACILAFISLVTTIKQTILRPTKNLLMSTTLWIVLQITHLTAININNMIIKMFHHLHLFIKYLFLTLNRK